MSTPGDLLDALGREARARLGGGAGAAAGAARGEQTRTYRGRSIEQLIPRIQQELGDDAVIVRRREGLTGGVLGFFQHSFVEVEAMAGAPRLDVYDDSEPAAPPSPATAPLAAGPAQTPAARSPTPELGRYPPRPAPEAQVPGHGRDPRDPGLGEPAASTYVTARLAALARVAGTAPAEREALARPTASGHAPLNAELAQALPSAMDFQELLPRRSATRSDRAPGDVEGDVGEERRTIPPGSHARARAGVERSLSRLGVGEELARELIEGAIAHTLPLAPRAGLAQAVRLTLARRIPVARPLPSSGALIVLVGGGGSGKTTCCASLLGAYRSGSVLPASYASVLSSAEGELQLILSPQIVKPAGARTVRAQRALRVARDRGLAILDTPSVSPAGRAEIRELARLVAALEPERVVVALPATLGAVAAAQLLRALVPLGANSMAITHADETDQVGVAVEAACSFGLAPEYLLERGRPGWRLRRVEPSELAGRLLP